MLVLRDRESVLRRRLMEHWAGSMAWEVRRLTSVMQAAEEKLAEAARNEAIIRKLEPLAARAVDLERSLVDRTRRMQNVERQMAETERKHRSLEEEFSQALAGRQQVEAERNELEQKMLEGSAHVSRWETAKAAIGQVLKRDDLDSVGEIVDAIKRMDVSLKLKDEELGVIKSEMREVGMGLEDELKRVADDRDTLKAQLEQATKAGIQEMQARDRQIADYQQRLLVSRRHGGTRRRTDSLSRPMRTSCQRFKPRIVGCRTALSLPSALSRGSLRSRLSSTWQNCKPCKRNHRSLPMRLARSGQ